MINIAPSVRGRMAVARWRDTTRWDVKSVQTVVWQWPAETLRPLSEALIRHRIPVLRTDNRVTDHQLITIRFDGSLTPRNPAGYEARFLGQLFEAPAGTVVYSKIDARNGAIGLVPLEMTNATVSSEYPVYRIRPDVASPAYVRLLFRSAPFRRLINALVSGASGRKRVEPSALETLRIPLPLLPEQAAMVAAAEVGEAEAVRLRGEAAAMEATPGTYLAERLGLHTTFTKPPKMWVGHWSETTRWTVEVAFRTHERASMPAIECYPIVQLGDVIADLVNGWSPQCLPRPAEPSEWGVLKLGAVSFGTYDDTENKALPPHLAPVASLEIKNGDVLISRANVLRLVGACAQVEVTRPKLLLCDKIFRVVFQPESLIHPGFLAEVMKTDSVRRQIEQAATGTSPSMKNISKPALLALRFPLPLPAQQEALLADLRQFRTQAATLRRQAAEVEAAARAYVEALILGSAPAVGAGGAGIS